jgi:outer membrane protein TolC
MQHRQNFVIAPVAAEAQRESVSQTVDGSAESQRVAHSVWAYRNCSRPLSKGTAVGLRTLSFDLWSEVRAEVRRLEEAAADAAAHDLPVVPGEARCG